MKHYNTDEVKAKSRVMLREFITSELAYKRPKDIKVLCFPGIDACEIFEVYDPLGIPRKNIVGLEYIPEVAGELEAKQLGIQVIPKSLEEYVLSKHKLDFDVVSLDFLGPITQSQLNAMTTISNLSQATNVVVHTNNMYARDASNSTAYVAYFGLADHTILHEPNVESVYANTLGVITKTAQASQSLAQKQGKQVKSDAMTGIIHATFSGQNKVVTDRFKQILEGQFDTALKVLKQQLMSSGHVKSASVPDEELMQCHPVFFRLFENVVYSQVVSKASYLGIAENQVPHIWNALFSNEKQRIIPAAQRYGYISESGSPFYGEMFVAHRPRALRDKESELRREFLKAQSMTSGLAKAYNALNDCVFDSKIPQFAPIPSRVYLGNGSRSPLTKVKYIAAKREGLTDSEIQAKYRGWDVRRIGAWKAHMTRGTYN
jgi:hypothetical protein